MHDVQFSQGQELAILLVHQSSHVPDSVALTISMLAGMGIYLHFKIEQSDAQNGDRNLLRSHNQQRQSQDPTQILPTLPPRTPPHLY